MTPRPDDIRAPLLWRFSEGKQIFVTGDGFSITDEWSQAEAFANPEAHLEPCQVYWGSHGCCRPRGHDGDHWCDCCECEDHPDPDSGCVAGPPYYGADTRFYGEGVEGWEPAEVEIFVEPS